MNPASSVAEVIPMSSRQSPSPKLEDGYTRIANELIEAIACAGFTANQHAVLWVILRKTYGYNKKSDDISLSQIAEMTGIDRSNVRRALISLSAQQVIIRSNGVHSNKISLNKNYAQWGGGKTTPGGVKVTPVDSGGKATPGGVKVTPVDSGVKVTPSVGSKQPQDVGLNQPPQKTTNQKTIPKEKNLLRNRNCASASFDKFWAIWPNKKDRKRSLAAFVKINPDDALLQTILTAVAAQSATAKWIEDGGKFIPHATTWLNGARWEDDVKPVCGSFNEQQQKFIDIFNKNIGELCQPVTDWSQKCADLINIALAGKWDSEGWERYWRYVRDKCQFKGQVSFEWLVTRDNLVRVKRGDFEVAE